MLITNFLQFIKSLYLLLVLVGCKAKILKNTCLQKANQTKLPTYLNKLTLLVTQFFQENNQR